MSTQSIKSMRSAKSVVIIGGGLGGLALALRLAVKGFTVTICEKNERLGGKMGILERDGFRFDTGPSLITLLDIFRETFQIAGSSLEDHLTPLRIDPLAHYIFADGSTLDYSTSLPEILETIHRLEPRDVDGFLRFMHLGSRIYNLSRNTFFEQSPFEFPPRLNLGVLKHLPLRYGWGNYAHTVDAHVRSPYLRQLYNRYPTYVGSSPYKTPATLLVIPFIEFAYGGWFIRGGLYRMIEALSELARHHGVSVVTNAEVTEILQTNSSVKGVRLKDGTTLLSDCVVMNGDASMVPQLLGLRQGSTLSLPKRSLSGIVFLAASEKTMPGLHHHSICFSESYETEFRQLFNERRFPDDPTVYVNVASRSDRTLVPANGETLFIMANAIADEHCEWNTSQIESAWQAISRRLQRSGFPEFQSSLRFREVWTPKTLAARCLMPGGAIYGQYSHGWKSTFLRPPNKDLKYRGLYYVGGSTHPGGGTPMVLLSAKITSRLMEHHETA